MQVTEYAQRFNLSASLAASVTRLSAWVSSAILLALLSIIGHSMHTLSAAHDAVSVTGLVTAVRGPLSAVAMAAAVVLMTSVPVSASLARKSRSQGPKRSLSVAAAGNAGVSDPASVAAASDDGQASADVVGDQTVGSGDANIDQTRHGEVHTGTAAEHAPVQGPEQEPSEGTMSEPCTLPDDSPASATGNSANVGTPGLGLDQNVHHEQADHAGSQSNGECSSGSGNAPVEGPVQEPSEETISDPATLPDDGPEQQAGNSTSVGTPGFGGSDVDIENVRTGLAEHERGCEGVQSNPQVSAESAEGSQAATSEAQLPADGGGHAASGGFFRDIETNCLPRRSSGRQRQLQSRPIHLRHVRHAQNRVLERHLCNINSLQACKAGGKGRFLTAY